MTLKELKEKLAEFPTGYDDYLIILQEDSKGNGYRLCEDIDAKDCFYLATSTWQGEVYTGKEIEDERIKSSVPCAVLYPVN